jgi:hypothetical protein
VFLLGDQGLSKCQFNAPPNLQYFIRKSFNAFTKLPALLPPNLLLNFGKKDKEILILR